MGSKTKLKYLNNKKVEVFLVEKLGGTQTRYEKQKL